MELIWYFEFFTEFTVSPLPRSQKANGSPPAKLLEVPMWSWQGCFSIVARESFDKRWNVYKRKISGKNSARTKRTPFSRSRRNIMSLDLVCCFGCWFCTWNCWVPGTCTGVVSLLLYPLECGFAFMLQQRNLDLPKSTHGLVIVHESNSCRDHVRDATVFNHIGSAWCLICHFQVIPLTNQGLYFRSLTNWTINFWWHMNVHEFMECMCYFFEMMDDSHLKWSENWEVFKAAKWKPCWTNPLSFPPSLISLVKK